LNHEDSGVRGVQTTITIEVFGQKRLFGPPAISKVSKIQEVNGIISIQNRKKNRKKMRFKGLYIKRLYTFSYLRQKNGEIVLDEGMGKMVKLDKRLCRFCRVGWLAQGGVKS